MSDDVLGILGGGASVASVIASAQLDTALDELRRVSVVLPR